MPMVYRSPSPDAVDRVRRPEASQKVGKGPRPISQVGGGRGGALIAFQAGQQQAGAAGPRS